MTWEWSADWYSRWYTALQERLVCGINNLLLLNFSPMLCRNLQRIILSFLAHRSWKHQALTMAFHDVRIYHKWNSNGQTSPAEVVRPPVCCSTALLPAQLNIEPQKMAWGLINQLISFKSVSLIIVISIADCSHCHLCLRVVLSLAQCQGIGAHWSWKTQGISLALDNCENSKGWTLPWEVIRPHVPIWIVLERFDCNRSTLALEDFHLIFMWEYWYWSWHL